MQHAQIIGRAIDADGMMGYELVDWFHKAPACSWRRSENCAKPIPRRRTRTDISKRFQEFEKREDLGRKCEEAMATKRRGNNIPKSLLDAAHIVHFPVLLGDIFLANRDTGPGNPHLSNTVHVVLVEVDLQSTEVALGPLGQTPLLLDQLVRLEFRVFADDIAVEDGELCANIAALELARGSAGECGNALRVCEGAVQFLGGGAELI